MWQKMQQFKVQSIWKQFETMDCLQQALCHTIWMDLFASFLGWPSGKSRQEFFAEIEMLIL